MFKDKFKDWINEEAIKIKVLKDRSKGKRKSNIKDMEVEALHKSGDWAAHLPAGKTEGKGSYTVTHLPSGMAAGIPGGLTNKKKAVKLVNALGKMSSKWDGKGKPPPEFIEQAKAIVKGS